jgi:hypothetical protein
VKKKEGEEKPKRGRKPKPEKNVFNVVKKDPKNIFAVVKNAPASSG